MGCLGSYDRSNRAFANSEKGFLRGFDALFTTISFIVIWPSAPILTVPFLRTARTVVPRMSPDSVFIVVKRAYPVSATGFFDVRLDEFFVARGRLPFAGAAAPFCFAASASV